MCWRLSSLFAVAVAINVAGAGVVQAESAWRIRHGNGQMWAEASSLSHGSTLIVQCDEASRSIVLNLQPPASWNGNAGYKMNVTVDDKPFAVVVDGIDDGVVLSNLPKEAVGIDRPLRNAIKAGNLLVLEGPPASGIPATQRSFRLNGASPAITRIESGCPGVR